MLIVFFISLCLHRKNMHFALSAAIYLTKIFVEKYTIGQLL